MSALRLITGTIALALATGTFSGAASPEISHSCRDFLIELAEEWKTPSRTATSDDLWKIDRDADEVCGFDFLPTESALQTSASSAAPLDCASHTGTGVISIEIDVPAVLSDPIVIPNGGSAELVRDPKLAVAGAGISFVGTESTAILVIGGVPILLRNPDISGACGAIKSKVCLDEDDQRFCKEIETPVVCTMSAGGDISDAGVYSVVASATGRGAACDPIEVKIPLMDKIELPPSLTGEGV